MKTAPILPLWRPSAPGYSGGSPLDDMSEAKLEAGIAALEAERAGPGLRLVSGGG